MYIQYTPVEGQKGFGVEQVPSNECPHPFSLLLLVPAEQHTSITLLTDQLGPGEVKRCVISGGGGGGGGGTGGSGNKPLPVKNTVQ